tara:strand:+ start:296 stop:571 length:276 start_codon:yes stop_codon:yes gene_type:complete
MSPHKSPNIIKYCIITSTAAVVFIAISLIPVSRKASYWNRCLVKTVRWINEKEKDLKGWDRETKESLAVAVCNGAVYEPKLQIKEFTSLTK